LNANSYCVNMQVLLFNFILALLLILATGEFLFSSSFVKPKSAYNPPKRKMTEDLPPVPVLSTTIQISLYERHRNTCQYVFLGFIIINTL
jgi:hypothetical protein